MSIIEFQITSGISCSSCANRLEKGLIKNTKIKNASVNFAILTAAIESELETKELIQFMNSLGFGATLKKTVQDMEEQEKNDSKKRKLNLVFCFLLSFPIVMIDMLHINFLGSNYVQFILATVIMLFPGRIFFTSAIKSAKYFSANMDTLVATSAFFAWLYSSYELFFKNNHHAHLYYETSAILLFFILVGKFLESKAKHKASEALRSLASLKPEIAHLIPQNVTSQKLADTSSGFSDTASLIEVRSIFLKEGDRILVRAGEKIPADGVIHAGQSEVDKSFLTGESIPVVVKEADIVLGGSINLSSPLEIKVTQTLGNSEIDKIIALVSEAQNSKTQFQRLADKISNIFVPFILILSLVCLILWFLLSHNLEYSLMNAIAVLVVACPCALGLATPTAILVATGRAAKQGILIKDASALEALAKINSIVFDKTGTLTEGKMHVVSAQDINPEIMEAIYLAEKSSSHPVAKALLNWLDINGFVPSNKKFDGIKIQEITGAGIEINLNDNIYYIGKTASDDIYTKIMVKKNDELCGVFSIEDKIREDAKSSILLLNKYGVNSILSSGDNLAVTKHVAEETGITEYYGNQTPSDKFNLIENLKKQNKLVAMVGDGINDAPALSSASVALAMGSGTQVAGASAQIILKNSSIMNIYEALKISKSTIKIIKQNLFWAFSYNIVLIPMAALGHLNPILASFFMGMSSVVVVLNSLRIKNKKEIIA